jgi:hypothetical protein
MMIKGDTFGGTVVNVGDSLVNNCGVVVEVVVEFAFVNELWVIRVCGFDFDGHFQVCFGVNGLVNLSEGSFIDLSDDLEVFTNLFKHLGHLDSVIKNN